MRILTIRGGAMYVYLVGTPMGASFGTGLHRERASCGKGHQGALRERFSEGIREHGTR